MDKFKKIFEKWLSNDIGLQFKGGLYFFCLTFFYCMVQIFKDIYTLDILILTEIAIVLYLICYVQMYLLDNFDESDKFGKNEVFGTAVCTTIYTVLSYILNWFGRGIAVTAIFAGYVILCYISVFLCYKIKRSIDTKYLNNMLEKYKQNERSN
ncbi:MAG: hypothetical protein ACI4IJ_10520 [Acutalibacteraceae bacterium]